MTEERINILGIVDTIKHGGGHIRSNSTGKIENFNGEAKIFSRYLRPSFGSCHDFCKYGEERALEMKARGPLSISNKITETLGEGQDLEKKVASEEKKKKLAVSCKDSRSSKIQKLDDPTVKGIVSSSPRKGIIHAIDPKMKLKLSKQSSFPISRYSIGESDRKIRKSKDMELFKLDAGIVRGVVSSPLKEIDILAKHFSDPKRKPKLPKLSKQFFLPIQISSRSGGERKARKSKEETKPSRFVSSLTKEEAKPSKPVSSLIKEETISSKPVSSLTKEETDPSKPVSSLTKEESISSKLVSSPLKEIDASVKHACDPKRKSKLSKQSSLPAKIFSNGGGDRSIRKNKDVRNLSMSSPRISSSRTKSKSKRSKEMRSSVKDEAKVAEPSSVSLSTRLPLRRVSSWNFNNSKQLNEVSRLSNKKAIRKPEPVKSCSEDLTEKTLHVVGRDAAEKTPSPVKNEIPATDLSPSSSSYPNDKILKSVQGEIHTVQLAPLSTRWKLRQTRRRIHATQSCRSWPSSRNKKGSRATQHGTRIARSDRSSLASLSVHGETDIEKEISDLEKELKNRGIKGEATSVKDERTLGQKLSFMRGNVVDLQLDDSTLERLKFKYRVPGEGQNGTTDGNTARLFPSSMKQNLRRSQKRIHARSTQKRIYARRTQNKIYDTQSLPSCPTSPKEEGLVSAPFGTCIARSYSFSLASWSWPGDASSELGETDAENQILDLENELKPMYKKVRAISLKDECSPGQMLSFQRGKVVDLQPEDITPRRLKYKQRVLGDNQDGEGDADADASRTVLGKQEADGCEFSGIKTESKNVVLKRQDVVKGENRSNLFNNVIEETVSELVKTRKSKVKALVGAFESLISRQGTKPSVTST